MSQLQDLKRWIYRQRIRQRQEKCREEKRREKELQEAAKPKQLGMKFE